MSSSKNCEDRGFKALRLLRSDWVRTRCLEACIACWGFVPQAFPSEKSRIAALGRKAVFGAVIALKQRGLAYKAQRGRHAREKEEHMRATVSELTSQVNS